MVRVFIPDVGPEIRFVAVGFSTGCVGAFEQAEVLVDAADVNFEVVFLGRYYQQKVFQEAIVGIRISLW